jgi:CO dehydrogenase/acetyl-CoA synthase beta subunit
MDARAASIKNDPKAISKYVGCTYWYYTGYGSGHTGLIHQWEENSNKFIGIDGNWSDQVAYVVRRKDRHAQYVANPYNDENINDVQGTKEYINFVKEEQKKKTVEIDVEQLPAEQEPVRKQTNKQAVMELTFYFGMLIVGIILIIIGRSVNE